MLNTQVARDNPAVDATFLPPKKATNKRIYPVQDTIGTVTDMGEAVQIPHQDMQQINSTQQKPADPYQTPGVNPNTKAADTGVQHSTPVHQPAAPAPTNSGGLLQNFANPSPIANSAAVKSAVTPVTYQPQEYKPVGTDVAATAPTMNVPTTSGGGSSYSSDGYTGVQGNTNFNYTPSNDSLVENRIGGLLDPNNALMRKAAALGNAYAANRGLQSSSIGGEIALSTMVDKALPIAQQDAQTVNQAQQLGWQQGWQSGENNLNRTHDTKMFDKQGKLQTDLQNSQQQFQAGENNANRQMQAELQQLQYKQSLGLLDAQGAQRMQELNAQAQASNFQQERGAQLQTERDQLMQQMQLQIADKSYLQQLELTKAQYEQADKTLMAQMNYQTQMEFKNATASAHNNYLQQVAAVYSNPNMTAQQQAAGVEQLRQAFESQRAMLQAVYGFSGNTPPNTTATGTGAGTGVGTGAGTGTSLPNPPQTTTNPFNGGYAEPRPVIGKGYAP